jgi:hypothetical protein
LFQGEEFIKKICVIRGSGTMMKVLVVSIFAGGFFTLYLLNPFPQFASAKLIADDVHTKEDNYWPKNNLEKTEEWPTQEDEHSFLVQSKLLGTQNVDDIGIKNTEKNSSLKKEEIVARLNSNS